MGMNAVNYHKELLKIIDAVDERTEREQIPSRLLLHSCCAPCSSYVLEYLSDYFEICDFFYNPNIYPETEYKKRVEEIKRLIEARLTRVASVPEHVLRSGDERGGRRRSVLKAQVPGPADKIRRTVARTGRRAVMVTRDGTRGSSMRSHDRGHGSVFFRCNERREYLCLRIPSGH